MDQIIEKRQQIEDFAQLLMDSNPQYIFWKDIDSVYLGCNQLYADFFGLQNTNDIVGTTDHDYMIHEEAEVCISADKEVMDDGNALLNFEEQVQDRNKNLRWFNINKIPLKDKQGNVVGVLGTMEDITEYKRNKKVIEEQSEILEYQLKKLTSKNKELEEFNYIVAHDLQEPVRNISNFGKLIAQKKEYNEEFMSYVLNGAERISSLLDALLSYYVIGNQKRKVEQIDLDKVINESLQQLKSKFNHIDYAVEIVDLPVISGVKVELVSLFQNLISNSIKYRDQNRKCQILISNIESDEKHIKICIEDNGIGMEQEQTERAIKIFQRLHNNKDIAGTGIGLSICTKIMALHSGSLTIESTVSEGTKVHLTFKK